MNLNRPEQKSIQLAMLLGLISASSYVLLYGLIEAQISTDRANAPNFSYVAAIVAIFTAYYVVVKVSYDGEFESLECKRFVIVFPVLVNLAFLFSKPLFSIDSLSYLAQGHMQQTYQMNPYFVATGALPEGLFRQEIKELGWIPVHGVSPYGPLWVHFESILAHFTKSTRLELLVEKLVMVALSLMTAWIIGKILERTLPQLKLCGLVLYLWNPAVIIEIAGEGHNHAAFMFFVLLSLFFTLNVSIIPSGVSAALSALVKYLSLILLPLQLVYLFRFRKSEPFNAFIFKSIVTIALCSGITVLLFADLWRGWPTLRGLRELSDYHFSQRFALVPDYLFPKATGGGYKIGRALSTALNFGFFFFVIRTALAKVKDPWSLMYFSGWISWIYLMLISPNYWPWYVLMPVALMATTPTVSVIHIVMITTLCSQIVAPFDLFHRIGRLNLDDSIFATFAIGLCIPVLAAIVIFGIAPRCRLTRRLRYTTATLPSCPYGKRPRE